MKKTLVGLLIVSLLATSLFAAPKKAKKAKKGKNKAMNISVFTIQQREQPPADNKAYKWIEDNFGVTFSWDILVGDKDQKIGVLIASGDLPDLVEVDSEKFQGAGCLRDLKPLVEKLLWQVPIESKYYSEARRLLNTLRNFIGIGSELIPSTSIIREFIGGGCYLR